MCPLRSTATDVVRADSAGRRVMIMLPRSDDDGDAVLKGTVNIPYRSLSI